jgi:hypothetical protein
MPGYVICRPAERSSASPGGLFEADMEQVSSGSNTAPGLYPEGTRDTDYRKGVRDFPHTLHANAEVVPRIRPRGLPSHPV